MFWGILFGRLFIFGVEENFSTMRNSLIILARVSDNFRSFGGILFVFLCDIVFFFTFI